MFLGIETADTCQEKVACKSHGDERIFQSRWEQRRHWIDIVMDVHQFNVCLCSSAWYIFPIRQHPVLSGLEPESQ